ncbi:MAG: hypothetical protein JWM66_1393, partial [Solirubrobacterales bacterium]|nr:hypothetical protein [Solirubrobacterales bacterium]
PQPDTIATADASDATTSSRHVESRLDVAVTVARSAAVVTVAVAAPVLRYARG